MATNPAVSIDARLVELLSRESCDNYFNEAVGRDSVMGLGGISADVDIIKNVCAMESIVDELLLEIGDAFELHKQQREATIKPSTLVHGRTVFAVPKTKKLLKQENPVCPRRSKQILSTVCSYSVTYMNHFHFSCIH